MQNPSNCLGFSFARSAITGATACALATATIGFIGCVSKPTVVRESPQRPFQGATALMGPVQIAEGIVVVDARSSFDYSMARVPRSVHINWADYSEAEPGMRGWPQRDLFAAARRLARLGIDLSTPVVVLGLGTSGQGEEGRVAWLLSYLGVRNVRFARFDSVKKRLTTEALPMPRETSESRLLDEGADDSSMAKPPQESPPTPAALWKPEVVSSLIVKEAEFKKAATSDDQVRVIDVRTEKEYLGTQGGLRARLIPNINAINIPWREFFTDDFRPNPEMSTKLQAIGLRPEQRLVVVDNDGLASSAVTMALRALGFFQAGVFAGGYNGLMDR